ncbi:hypothetical protein [Vibrio neptunius]|uniref:hypothetical protein n=1 Tax=Vibrio neptunius TaxID=170651 RepID=UPI003315A2A4
MKEIYDIWALAVFWVIASCVIMAFATIPFKRWEKRGKVVIALFCISAASFMSIFLLDYFIKKEVSELITADSVIVESQENFNTAMFLRALRNKQYITTHRTKPLERSVLLIDTHLGQLELEVAQDSEHPHLYWVYYPKYRYSHLNELGKVRVK